MGADDDQQLGFIEEALRHRQVKDQPDQPDEDVQAALPVDEADPANEPTTVTEPDQPTDEPDPEPPPAPTFTDWPIADRALVDEALKKSGLVWVETKPGGDGEAFWHVWLDDVVYLLTGSGEQPARGLAEGATATVLVRSKDTLARLLSIQTLATLVRPEDDDWERATKALAGARLNLPDPQGAPERWAADAECEVFRLVPNDAEGERPGSYSPHSHRAAPRPSTATTAGAKPWVAHRRHGSGRALS